MRLFLLAGVFPVLLIACSASRRGEGACISGTFAGQTPAAADSAAFSGASANGAFFSELITSTAGACTTAQHYANKANSSRLELVIQSYGPSSPLTIPPGTYAITNGDPADDTNGTSLEVSADYNALDATCSPTIAGTTSVAVSGTITIASVSDAEIVGSFALTFPSGDHLSGDFRSPVCSAAASLAPTPPQAGGSDAPDTATTQACEP